MSTPSSKGLAILGVVLGLATTHALAQHAGHAIPMSAPTDASRSADQSSAQGAPDRPVAKPSAQPATTAPAPAIDHAAMGHDTPPAAEIDHASMGHAVPPAGDTIDHAGMDHGATHDATAGTAMDGVDHASMPDMDHAAMGHGRDADLPADAAPRTPIPPVTDADRAAAVAPASGHAAHDRSINTYWLVDRLEWQDTEADAIGWEGLAWIGGDTDRVWLRTEGEAEEGALESADVEVLYGRSVSPWWDAVAGLRHDFGHGPSRTWAAFGFQGLSPYKFEVEATAYVGSNGRTSATLEAEYDTLLTNRLILQWQADMTVYGKDDPAVGVGSGLSTIEAGMRLRYEFNRRFAPYVGVELERAFGQTADYRRLEGESASDSRLVAGVRFWF